MSTKEDSVDGVLMGLAQQTGDIGELLSVFCGFLHRRTDFYVVNNARNAKFGFPTGGAEKLLLKAFRSFPLREADSVPATALPPSDEPPRVADPAPVKAYPAVRLSENGSQIPVGNGGICPTYWWNQTLGDVTVFVPFPPGTRGKDIDYCCTKTTLKCGLKGEPALVEGRLPKVVKEEDCMWSIDGESGLVSITLDKVVRTWWECVVKGDPEIDTSKVDSTVQMSEYDEETQASIRKIMFEQQQKRQ